MELKLVRRLKVDKAFTPCPSADNDEMFPNGIFEFNITKMLAFIQNHPDDFCVEAIAVNDFQTYSSINESHLNTVDISRPVLLAEIAPRRYNLIDGHHRVEKARRMSIKSLSAYKVTVEQHLCFLTSKKAYLTYIDYWNSKLK